jgi:hypothetical protein
MSKNATLRPDIARAAGRMSARFGGKREMRELVEHLGKGETVDMLAVGWHGKGNGLLALTNHRLIFLLRDWRHEQLDDYPLGDISAVQWTPSVITGTLTVYAGGNKIDIHQIAMPDGRALSDRLRTRISATGTAAA